MNKGLTFGERLGDLRDRKGLTLQEVEDATGISRSALGRYENDKSADVSVYNLKKLAKFYGVSGDYLLELSEQPEHTDTPIEDLHIDNDMIDILKSGRVNNRLLSEIVTSSHFVRFMLDAEAFVDRLMSYVVSLLNDYYKKGRKELYEKGGGKIPEDAFTRSLDLFPMDDNKYMRDILHDDLDMIMDEIQEKHREDPTTMNDDELKKLMEEAVEKAKEAAEDEKYGQWAQTAAMFCAPLGIRFHNLTDHQKHELIEIFKTSRMLYPGMSQRGRKSKTIKKMAKKRIGEEI